jgi:hypothetical protein
MVTVALTRFQWFIILRFIHKEYENIYKRTELARNGNWQDSGIAVANGNHRFIPLFFFFLIPDSAVQFTGAAPG